MPDRLTRLLAERPWLLADGATGTNYFALGLETGDAPELWNLEWPERVSGLHRAFIEAGGYREPRWWLSEGWALRETEGWQHPLYWDDTLQREYTLGGWRELDPHAPVCHLSYYEADACARWAGA